MPLGVILTSKIERDIKLILSVISLIFLVFLSLNLPMLKQQSQLPTLPVPELSDTFQKYLKTVQPFLSVEDEERHRLKVESFVQSDRAAELQRRLKERAATANGLGSEYSLKLWKTGEDGQ